MVCRIDSLQPDYTCECEKSKFTTLEKAVHLRPFADEAVTAQVFRFLKVK